MIIPLTAFLFELWCCKIDWHLVSWRRLLIAQNYWAVFGEQNRLLSWMATLWPSQTSPSFLLLRLCWILVEVEDVSHQMFYWRLSVVEGGFPDSLTSLSRTIDAACEVNLSADWGWGEPIIFLSLTLSSKLEHCIIDLVGQTQSAFIVCSHSLCLALWRSLVVSSFCSYWSCAPALRNFISFALLSTSAVHR